MKKENKNKKYISISWWIGGTLIPRLKLNPVRKKFLGPKTDISAHGKALIFRNTEEEKRQRAWTPGRFFEVATGALRFLLLKALAQNVQD